MGEMHPIFSWSKPPFEFSTDRTRLDQAAIHGFLTRSYWAAGISKAVVEKSIEHSLPFGVYLGAEQIGFARVLSDYATFAYLADVFVLEPWRGRGLSKALVNGIRAHPELQGLRRWILATADAHGLYARFGFSALSNPTRFMEINDAHCYRQEHE